MRKNTSFWVSPGRCEQWWLNLVTGVTINEWKKNFRMSRTSFYELVQDIQPFISPNLLSINLRIITAEKKLAITLYYLKDTGSFTMATNTVGLIVYLNTAIKHSTVHHFVDDTNMLLINKSLIKTIKILIMTWLSLNTYKTEILIFRSKNKILTK